MFHLMATLGLLIFAEGEEVVGPWWDYPGFELWKFVNLFLFAALAVYFFKGKISTTFATRKETIQRELNAARKERDEARAQLAEVQARLQRLDSEVAAIQEHSKTEAQLERDRLIQETEEEVQKLRQQAQREIIGAGKVARQELRRFAAQQSVQMAEEMIRREIRPDDDTRLINRNVEQLGGVGR